jgi:CheY-like chemotaxis protein
MKKVLIVDDEKLFLKSLREGLNPFAKKHNFKVLTAENGRKAMEVLEKEDVSLLITDIKMPEIDGLTLISHTMNHYPTLPVVVMTAYGSPQVERIAREKGALRYLEKPVDFDQLLKITLELLSRNKRRRIQGVTLPTFLQLLEMEKDTCMLAVAGASSQGVFYIRDGQLVEAETGGRKGLAAALDMLNWNDVRIELEEGCSIKTGSIVQSLTEVLLEAFRLKDEWRQKTIKEDLTIEVEDFHQWDLPIELDSALKDIVDLRDSLPAASPDPAVHPATGDTITVKVTTDKSFKEVYMNIQKLNKAVETLKESLGVGLLATDIYGAEDGQTLVGFNSKPEACAVFTQITDYLNKALVDTKLPEIGRYYLLDLVDQKMILVIPMGDFIWSMLIDGNKTKLGMLLNLVIPKAIEAFEEALAG